MVRLNGGKVANLIAAFVLALSVAGAAEQTVSLDEAWARVQARSPALAQAAAAVRATEGTLGQARALPNPELEFVAEDLGRGAVEVGVTLPLDIGGQYRARVRSARVDQTAARLEQAAARDRTRAETLRRFAAALALKNKTEIADTLLDLLRSSVADIERRVRAGAAGELDLDRERIELASLEVEARGLARGYDAACRALAALWADTPGTYWRPAGSFVRPAELPGRAELLALLAEHPVSRLNQNWVEAARAGVSAARAAGFPTPTLFGGVVRATETGQRTTLLGAATALPFFDWNAGAVRAARHTAVAAEHAATAAGLDLEAQVDRVLSALAGLSEAIEAGHSTILPAHRRVLSTLTRHYQQGAVSVGELIQAQRGFHQASMELVDAGAERASLAADLLEMTGYETAAIKE